MDIDLFKIDCFILMHNTVIKMLLLFSDMLATSVFNLKQLFSIHMEQMKGILI